MIKVLLDTNIIVYRESDNVYKERIGELFKIIDDNPDMYKYIHPVIKSELLQNLYNEKRDLLLNRLTSYNVLKGSRTIDSRLFELTRPLNKTINDQIDDIILNEVYTGKVDFLITEDKKIKEKAMMLDIGSKVMTINEFIYFNKEEKSIDHNILDIYKVKFGDLDINDSFFDSLKRDYPEFLSWYNKKKNEDVYYYEEHGKILGLLFLKNEEPNLEDYSDIKPSMRKSRKLKISTFKVEVRGKKIGERFMKIIFDQALFSMVDEIYVTIYDNDDKKLNLINYFERFGFVYHGKKKDELVYVRSMKKVFDSNNPLMNYPYINRSNDTFIIPIKPKYHTYLLPDSKLYRESYKNIHMPVEYAINKYYVTNCGWLEIPKIGDNIIFYRSCQEGAIAKYSSVLTTIGVVTNIFFPQSVQELIDKVSGRTVYSEDELKSKYGKNTYVIEFAYITTLGKKLNYDFCKKNNILETPPMGVVKIETEKFQKIIEFGQVDTSLVIK